MDTLLVPMLFLFWPFSTYVAVIIFGCPKIVIGLGTAGVPAPPSKLGKQKPVEVNYCISWSLCVSDHIISTAENLFG